MDRQSLIAQWEDADLREKLRSTAEKRVTSEVDTNPIVEKFGSSDVTTENVDKFLITKAPKTDAEIRGMQDDIRQLQNLYRAGYYHYEDIKNLLRENEEKLKTILLGLDDVRSQSNRDEQKNKSSIHDRLDELDKKMEKVLDDGRFSNETVPSSEAMKPPFNGMLTGRVTGNEILLFMIFGGLFLVVMWLAYKGRRKKTCW